MNDIIVQPMFLSAEDIVKVLLDFRLMSPSDAKLFAAAFKKDGGIFRGRRHAYGRQQVCVRVTGDFGSYLGLFARNDLLVQFNGNVLPNETDFDVEGLRACNNYDEPNDDKMVLLDRRWKECKSWLLKNWFEPAMEAEADAVGADLAIGAKAEEVIWSAGDMLVRMPICGQEILIPRQFLVPCDWR